jgi:hypothetical protein
MKNTNLPTLNTTVDVKSFEKSPRRSYRKEELIKLKIELGSKTLLRESPFEVNCFKTTNEYGKFLNKTKKKELTLTQSIFQS